MSKSLLDLVIEGYERVFYKHRDAAGTYAGFNNAEEYATHMVNSMTQYEFLVALSDAMQELRP